MEYRRDEDLVWRTGEATTTNKVQATWSTGALVNQRGDLEYWRQQEEAQATWSTGALLRKQEERRMINKQSNKQTRKGFERRIRASERIQLIESTKRSTCDRLNKRHSKLTDRGEVQRKAVQEFMQKVSALQIGRAHV